MNDCGFVKRALSKSSPWLVAATIGLAPPVLAQTYTQTEAITYYDNAAKWVLGQVAKREVNGVTTEETTFTVDGMPHAVSAFGELQSAFSFNPNGTLSSVQDANGYTTHYSNWKRGTPQLVAYPDSYTQQASINDQGLIESFSDELGNQTELTYDVMGRLASRTPPPEATHTWNATTSLFEQVSAPEYGISAGHWRHTLATGNARKVTYFNEYWQPLLVHEFDASAQAATQRFRRFSYDAEGRQTFASYPSASSLATSGQWTSYDALGRVTSTSQDSDTGLLTTLTEHLAGHRTRVSDPLGHQVVTEYQSFDTPGYEFPTRIETQGDAVTEIARDTFGKVTAITRRNASGSLSLVRRYVYQSDQRLCKQLEPESGATVYGYDPVGNITQTSSGLDLAAFASLSDCQQAAAWSSGRTVTRSYDSRRRLLSLNFPIRPNSSDSRGEGDQVWQYTPDGLPAQVTTYNASGGDAVVNHFSYNNRRLITSEDMSQPGALDATSMDYDYNANGHLQFELYPSGLGVAYDPNALGQPTRAGAYATGVSYFPNGDIKQYAYGNGIVHTALQNARQLTARATDGAALDLGYSYDGDGNVSGITDHLDGRQTRLMTYDVLHRLRTANSAMFAGDGQAEFTYDALDNLKSFKVGTTRSYLYAYNNRQQLALADSQVPGGQDISISYDAQGNVINRGGEVYRFDYGNRLREAVGKEAYRYDAAGRRVLSDSPVLGKIFSLYDSAGKLRWQKNQRTGKTSEFVQLNGRLIAEIQNAQTLPIPTASAPGSSSNGLYTVSWTSLDGMTSYQAQEGANGNWVQIYSGSGASVVISGKGNGVYSYRARACLYANCGDWSNEATVSVQLIPSSAPSITTPATALDGSYTAGWSTIANSTSYRLEQRSASGAWAEVYSGAGHSHVFAGLPAGTYYHRVRACSATGCSGYSNEAQTQIAYTPTQPAPPSLPGSSATGAYSIGWSAVSHASSYRLEEALVGGGWAEIVSTSGTGHSVSGRSNGTYQYRLRGCNDLTCGAYSGASSITVLHPPSSAPSISAPGSSSNGSYSVAWGAVSGASSYELQENGTVIFNGGGMSASVGGRGNGTYQYRARACNASGCGPWSQTASTSVLLPPAGAPSISAPANNNTGSYTVTWSGIAGASSYELLENGGAVYNAAGTSYGANGRGAGSYQYSVRACNPSGCGAWSGTATTVVTLVPPTPTGLNANIETISYKQKRFSAWWDASPGATSYQLIGYMTYSGTALSKTMVVNTGSYPNPTPQYQVRACNAHGCSPYSQVVYSGQE